MALKNGVWRINISENGENGENMAAWPAEET
jgi:hypothetical protein